MLLDLNIKSFAIIDELNLEFSEGLNVLTGETGTGKSIILSALQLILGERASTDLIRTGAKKASVEATFLISDLKAIEDFIKENSLINEEEPEKLFVRREILTSGNNRCFINGVLVPVIQLKNLGDLLVDLHGQHQHQTLLSTESQRELLDIFANLGETLMVFRKDYDLLRSLIKRLESLRSDERESERRKDFLKFQIEEIKKAELKIGEDNELGKVLARLRNAKKLKESASLAYDILYEGETTQNPVVNLLAQIESEIQTISTLDTQSHFLLSDIAEITSRIESLASNLRDYRDSIEEDPETLKTLEDRRELIQDLKKKYGANIEDILNYAGKIKKELNSIENRAEEIEVIESEINKLKEKLTEKAVEISKKRRTAAKKLEKQTNILLGELNLPHSRFTIAFRDEKEANTPETEHSIEQNNEGEKGTYIYEDRNEGLGDLPFGRNGIDQIAFLFSANPGEELRPLKKIVSGGELSRIMLALKSHLASRDQIPTIVFDEIDVGIGGATADKVGKKMASIGKYCQVICVTHLSQIACYAQSHFAVKKFIQDNRTFTTVQKLAGEESKEEIARMIGGEKITPTSLKHAEELIKQKEKV